jgi:hypothetical protein
MWTYPGPSCPNRPSSEELSAVEVEEWIHKVLDLTVIPTLSPYREGSLVSRLVL